MNIYYKFAIMIGPPYIVAFLTDKMVYVIPMLAACTLIANIDLDRDKRSRRTEQDTAKDAQLGARKDDG